MSGISLSSYPYQPMRELPSDSELNRELIAGSLQCANIFASCPPMIIPVAILGTIDLIAYDSLASKTGYPAETPEDIVRLSHIAKYIVQQNEAQLARTKWIKNEKPLGDRVKDGVISLLDRFSSQ